MARGISFGDMNLAGYRSTRGGTSPAAEVETRHGSRQNLGNCVVHSLLVASFKLCFCPCFQDVLILPFGSGRRPRSGAGPSFRPQATPPEDRVVFLVLISNMGDKGVVSQDEAEKQVEIWKIKRVSISDAAWIFLGLFHLLSVQDHRFMFILGCVFCRPGTLRVQSTHGT